MMMINFLIRMNANINLYAFLSIQITVAAS